MTRVRANDKRDAVGRSLLFDAERHCVLCGRRLRSDTSVRRQYGPTCYRKRFRGFTVKELEPSGTLISANER